MTNQTPGHSSLFDSDDDGEDIFAATTSPSKTKKEVTSDYNPLIDVLDTDRLSPYLTPSTQSPERTVDVSGELGSQNIADSSEDFEKELVAEKARSSTFSKLNDELYEKLESVENEFEQVKSDYAVIQEKLSSKLSEESQWNSQKEVMKNQIRISQEEIQKLKTENQELLAKSQMENDTVVDPVPALEEKLDAALADKEETNQKLHKVEKALSELRKEKTKQDTYITELKSDLSMKDKTISELEQKASVENTNKSVEDHNSTISQLEKNISLKDQKISELEDLAVIARRSQRQDEEMKLKDERIISLERRVEFLQNQDRVKTRSPSEDRVNTPSPVEPMQPTFQPSPRKSAPVQMESPKISVDSVKNAKSSLPPHEPSNKTAVIVDKQTGKSLRTATLEERIKKFRGSAENIASDETSATKHTFRRVSSSGSARSTPSPDLVNPRAVNSQPVSPDLTVEKIDIDPTLSLPQSALVSQKAALPLKKTYSPLPTRSKVEVDQDTCIACGRRAYPIEKITVDKMPYHKFCFKCTVCKSILRPGRHASYEGTIYCLNHFKQEFKSGGGKYPGQVRY
eukprot:TRINITY_DN6045_c0_g1_i1.p1 TRINITY_DN6045_c0_g1~~TRINITY_DN6045_c0_g1_i1.p1  ORF type:complete len:572 (+),score=133.19 TRINITY_DN6045_c0_g1_i1:415-2130(+)